MTAWLHDLRYSLTTLRKRPLYALVTVLVFAIAIGANSTVFGVLNGFFLRPLPYPDGDRLVMVYDSYQKIGLEDAGTAIPDYLERREQAPSLEELAIVRTESKTLGDGAPQRVLTAYASPSLFEVLKTEPSLGRRFTEAETDDGNAGLAVLSHRLWRDRFGARPDVIGQQIRLDGETLEIIGVMPEGFGFPNGAVDAWLPFVISPEQRTDAMRGMQFSISIGRLRPGATVDALNSELAAIVRRNVDEGRLGADAIDVAGFTGKARTLREYRVGDLEQVLLVMQAIVLAVLLIACANVANLQLARVAGRRRELAIRTALGAGTARLVRLVVAESILLALVGAALGLVLAGAGTALVRELGLERDGFTAAIDWRVLVFTFGAALIAGVASGLPPLFALLKQESMQTLREVGRHGGGGRSAQAVRNVLVVAQLALSVALLVGAGLLTKSFYTLRAEGTGFDTTHVWTARLALPQSSARYAEPDAWVRLYEQALDALQALPGVQAAGFTSLLPFTGMNNLGSIRIEDLTLPPGAANPHAQHRSIDAGYLPALGIPMSAGRNFTDDETELVAIVDENLAAKYWPDGGAIGQRIQRVGVDDDRWYTIVGVVPAVKELSLADAPEKETVYWHYRQQPASAGAFVLRTMLPPAQLTNAAAAAIASLDPELALFDVATMEARVRRSLGPQRTPMVLTGLFAVTAFALAVIGVYGVLNWAVTQRIGDIGVRVALGAQSSDILRMVIGHGLRLIAVGLALGLVGAAGLGRILGSQISEVSSTDPVVFASAALALTAAALIASWLPARRAARIAPTLALRAD
jgi:predicted permease